MINVVIADDEVRVCNLICNLIDWPNLEMRIVGTAHDGLQAFALVEEQKPDLIITDIRMPGMDGLTMIGKAKAVCPDAEIIIISGYRDFEYAQDAIKFGVNDYLLKPVKKEELEGTLENIRRRWHQRTENYSKEEELLFRLQSDSSQLRGFFFRDVLLCEKQDADATPIDIETARERYHFRFEPGIFRAFAVKLDFPCREEYTKSGTAALKSKIIELLHRQLRPMCIEEECFLQRSFIFGIMNYEAGNAERIRRQILICMNEMLSQKSMFRQVEFTFGLGSVQNHVDGLWQSMRDAVIAANHRLIDRTGARVIENAAAGEIDAKPLLDFFKATLAAPVEILDTDAVLAAVDALQRQVLASPNAGGQAIYLFVPKAFDLFLIVMRSAHSDMIDMRRTAENFLEQAELAADAPALFCCLKEEMAKLMAAQMDRMRQSALRPVRNAKQYIQEHYRETITLEEVSGIAGFNASYFSVLFKKECGMTFLEYLSSVRISKAKALLRDTQLSIAEVCGKVGYLDLKHFNKTFKKITSLSPAEFRKLYS